MIAIATDPRINSIEAVVREAIATGRIVLTDPGKNIDVQVALGTVSATDRKVAIVYMYWSEDATDPT